MTRRWLVAVVRKSWQLVRGDIFERLEPECDNCKKESSELKPKDKYWVRKILGMDNCYTDVLAIRESDGQLVKIHIAVGISLLVIDNKPIPTDGE